MKLNQKYILRSVWGKDERWCSKNVFESIWMLNETRLIVFIIPHNQRYLIKLFPKKSKLINKTVEMWYFFFSQQKWSVLDLHQTIWMHSHYICLYNYYILQSFSIGAYSVKSNCRQAIKSDVN